jgi:hypothetical protein
MGGCSYMAVALVGDGACALNPEVTIAISRTRSNGWLSILMAIIIFMSTCSVYGAQDKD